MLLRQWSAEQFPASSVAPELVRLKPADHLRVVVELKLAHD